MAKGQDFEKKGKCKHWHCSPMSNSAWCDFNSKGDTLKVHDKWGRNECKCQKQCTFSPKQFQLEGGVFKKTMKKVFKGTEKMWDIFIKPGLKIATPIISAGVAAKTKNLQSAAVTSNSLKWLTSGKILTYMQSGAGLRLRGMWFYFK